MLNMSNGQIIFQSPLYEWTDFHVYIKFGNLSPQKKKKLKTTSEPPNSRPEEPNNA